MTSPVNKYQRMFCYLFYGPAMAAQNKRESIAFSLQGVAEHVYGVVTNTRAQGRFECDLCAKMDQEVLLIQFDVREIDRVFLGARAVLVDLATDQV